MTSGVPAFHELGSVTDGINVEISLQIIGLFSEGLYSSPNKALEELVSNSFDADASKVHVVLPPDRTALDAAIVVIDNGVGMDAHGLKIHWIVGDSTKNRNRQTTRGRRTIGKFGIGKLAAYVLGNRLSHFSKVMGKYYSTSMNFGIIPRTADVDQVDHPNPEKAIKLDLRELTEVEIKAALRPWLTTQSGRKSLDLFGQAAADSWTVAVISDLKPMASDLLAGRLRWVLATAMPLRDDFALFLNDAEVTSSKIKISRVGKWTLGREIQAIPKPAAADVEFLTNSSIKANSYEHWEMIDPIIGKVTGYLEVFEDPIDSGKSDTLMGRSNGFFVYVNGRLINPEDAGFGIDRNKLRHGTFSRFRVVVNIDRLDTELRSSRESLRDSTAVNRSRDLLQGLFNFARSKLEAHESSTIKERRVSERFADSPASLAERPILELAYDAFVSDFAARHLAPIDRTKFATAEALVEHIEERIETGDGLIASVSYQDLGPNEPIASLDVASGVLAINLEHPFVAHFADQFNDTKRNLPLELFATAEVVLEASLASSGISVDIMTTILDARDELLRHLARSSGVQNSLTVAQGLLQSSSSPKGLERALVDAFQSLGFEAVPKAGNDETDGIAEAHLPGGDGLTSKQYRVSLEAKSKGTPGGRVKKKDVEVSTIARHRDEANCAHAIVVGPDFETGSDDLGAVIREIDADRKSANGKTITLMRITDLARLIRIAPIKRLNLLDIRSLFACRTPNESASWVDEIDKRVVSEGPYRQILEAVWRTQKEDKQHTVDYGTLRTTLRLTDKITMLDADLRDECSALGRMAPNYFVARDSQVELNIKPDTVMKAVHDYIDQVPKEID